jgi:hypothetical protein
MSKEVAQLHNALSDLVGFMNRPQRDTALIQEAGISLDRALFPLLMGIRRHGPIGIVELAELAGGITRLSAVRWRSLNALGLSPVSLRKPTSVLRAAAISVKGREMAAALDQTRERLATEVLANWTKKDLQDLVRLRPRFADDLLVWRT